MAHVVTRKEIQGLFPGMRQGYFTWIRREGKSEEINGKWFEVDAFDEVFIVCAEGTVVIEEGQFSSTTPVKYCKDAKEAITLVNQLNAALRTKDLSLPYAQCPQCQSDNVRQSEMHFSFRILNFHCTDCNEEFVLSNDTQR